MASPSRHSSRGIKLDQHRSSRSIPSLPSSVSSPSKSNASELRPFLTRHDSLAQHLSTSQNQEFCPSSTSQRSQAIASAAVKSSAPSRIPKANSTKPARTFSISASSAADQSSQLRTPSQSPHRPKPAGPQPELNARGVPDATDIMAGKSSSRNRLRRQASFRQQRNRPNPSASTASSQCEAVPALPPLPFASSPMHSFSTDTLAGNHFGEFDNTILGISMPTTARYDQQPTGLVSKPAMQSSSVSRMPSFASRLPQTPPTQRSTPPTPFAAYSSASSARWSESPGPFSRASTPTSASSRSPSIFSTPKLPTYLRRGPSPAGSRPSQARNPVHTALNPSHEQVQQSPSQRPETPRSGKGDASSSWDLAASLRLRSPARKLHKQPPPAWQEEYPQSSHGVSNSKNVQRNQEPQHTTPPTQSRSSADARSTERLPDHAIPRNRQPPARPSRQGTPSLESPKQLPTIQSNLVPLQAKSKSIRRKPVPSSAQPSMGQPLVSDSVQNDKKLPRLPFSTNVDDDQPSFRGRTQHSSRGSEGASKADRRVDDCVKPARSQPTSGSVTPTSESKLSSRFGFFMPRGWKHSAKTNSDQAAARPSKKGPAAGTGHEGYGKYALRGRTTSTSLSSSRGRSGTVRSESRSQQTARSRDASLSSNGSHADLDDFLRTRLEPVVMNGGGAVRRTPSISSHVVGHGHPSRPIDSFRTNDRLVDEALPPKNPARFATGAVPSMSAAGHLDSQITAKDHDQNSVPTLAHRRSLHRSQLLGETASPNMPPPLQIRSDQSSPSLDTYDSTVPSTPNTLESPKVNHDYVEGREGMWLKSSASSTPRSRLQRKHNFMQISSQGAPRIADTAWDTDCEPAASFSPGHATRCLPHYALMDELDDNNVSDLDKALREIENDLQEEHARHPSSPPAVAIPAASHDDRTIDHSSGLIPSAVESSSSPRPKRSRLPRVGRIPDVASRQETQPVNAVSAIPESIKSEPSFAGDSVRTPDTKRSEGDIDMIPSNGNGFTANNYALATDTFAGKEFLSFPPRQQSEVSMSSSSGNDADFLASLARHPEAQLGDDEIWNEYDELLDHVAMPVQLSLAALQYDRKSALEPLPDFLPYRSAAKAQCAVPEDSESLAQQVSSSKASRLSVLASQLRILDSPGLTSPGLFDDIYGPRKQFDDRGSSKRESHSSSISGSRYSSQTIISTSSSPTIGHDTDLVSQSPSTPSSKALSFSADDLRLSALMTSRWLSFDRVLFSPVQEEICQNRQDRILVIDGLENDDWSIYCARTYSQALVYNLCPISHLNRRASSDSQDGPAWTPPPNHRRVAYGGLASPIPFPKGFFAVAVVRFPAAATSSAYRNAASELKRVLRPGGFLELSMLDMDMMNMGSLGRRAVRNLKMQMQTSRADISLSPVSDTMTKLIARKGFENLNHCLVGIPAAGVLADSRAGSLDGRRSSLRSVGADMQSYHATPAAMANSVATPTALPTATAPNTALTSVSQRQSAYMPSSSRAAGQPTLQELLSGRASTAELHHPVAKMVPRVGRWWWSRCYETPLFGDVDPVRSIWLDPSLLAECEECETSFRLMVCYAQKPISARRRTASV